MLLLFLLCMSFPLLFFSELLLFKLV
uniref:Uncharacterized protein n=1 Tax=Anguilla anguilla TaxID=7936 RepID=A0A0E9S1C0_ANGAN